LGETKTSADYSTALEALRTKVSGTTLAARLLNILSRQIANRLLKIAGKGETRKKAPGVGAFSSRSQLRFTLATGKAAVGLAESLIKLNAEILSKASTGDCTALQSSGVGNSRNGSMHRCLPRERRSESDFAMT